MAKPFLYAVAETYFSEYGYQLSNVRFVFPNRRAGVFFQKYLAELIDRTIQLPEITTINEWVAQLSDFDQAENLDLLFDLYHIYTQTTGRQETFDEFYFWGNILLSDFDEIDKFMVDAPKLYANIVALKEIEANFAGLEEEQVEAIKTFWSNFQGNDESEIKDAFLKSWQTILPVYQNFKRHLIEKKLGYDGLLYRKIAEEIVQDKLAYTDKKTTVFAGFNALNTCEETIFNYFKTKHKAEFCWDYTHSVFMNASNNATRFMKKNIQRFPQKQALKLTHNEKVVFRSIAVPSVTGQAYICNDLIKASTNGASDLTKKVVILNDESLLSNVLYSIPEELEAINITMGYPVKGSNTLSLLNLLVRLQKNARKSADITNFYSRDVIDILQHDWVNSMAKHENSTKICEDITGRNLIYWKYEKPFDNTLLDLILGRLETPKNLPEWLMSVLESLLESWNDETSKLKDGIASIEKETLFFIINHLSRLAVKIEQTDIAMNLDVMSHIIYRATERLSIPFEGEPLRGLQLMGVLESRTVDFEELIFLSFNERIFPKRNPDNTFIPYNLRKGYGLTTVEYHDAMHAYYFYRLLQRAKKVTLVYNTSQSGIYPSEPSRYLLQLKYLYRVHLQEESASFEPGLKKDKEIVVEATDETDRLLQKYLGDGGKFLSPSALNTYVDCSLKFYFTYLKELNEEEEIEEEIDARVFGSIYHEAIEHLYAPYENQTINNELLSQLEKSPNIDDELRKAMARNYFKCPVDEVEIKGQFQIIFSILKKYIKKTFNTDKQFTPFTYLKGEKRLYNLVEMPNGKQVKLGGIIDRIDKVKGEVRIIDYKTGKADKSDMGFSNINDLFRAQKKRSKYVFQTLFYLLIYRNNYTGANAKAGIYFLRNLYSDPFLWEVLHKEKTYTSIADFTPFVDEFEEELYRLLQGLFVERTPFTQTEVLENCEYCPFKTVCMR